MALPTYERTILRQVQEADMSEANVWKTLAVTMDNFSSQIGSFTSNQIANEKSRTAAAKAATNQQRLADERATSVYVNSKESAVMTGLSQLSIDYENDYDGYIKAANKLQDVWLSDDTLDGTAGM